MHKGVVTLEDVVDIKLLTVLTTKSLHNFMANFTFVLIWLRVFFFNTGKLDHGGYT